VTPFVPPKGNKPVERVVFAMLNGCYWLHDHQRLRILTTFAVLAVSFIVVDYIGFWVCVPPLIYGTAIGYTAAVHNLLHSNDPLVRWAFQPPTEEGL
jgi:hypothetical protein